jgi:hypothetical protein
MDAIFLRNLCRLVVLSAFLIFSSDVIGQQWDWVAADSSWVGKKGTDPWRLRGRTGMVSDSGRYYLTDYFVNDKIKGFLEYLPSGYATNSTKKYPLIIYFPGCGEIHNGVTYLHGAGGQPNYYFGIGRLFAQGNPPHADLRLNAVGASQKFSGEAWWSETIDEFKNGVIKGTSTEYYIPGALINNANGKEELYRSGRSGTSFSYNFSIWPYLEFPPATRQFLVRLHFSELEFGAPGNRFTVSVEGTPVEIDIYAAAGANTAYIYETVVSMNTDNLTLNIDFSATAGNVAKISAIEVKQLNPPTPGNGFESLPRQLRDNGDYFSEVPLKTLGEKYSSSGPKEGVIVLSMMQYGYPTVCDPRSSVLTDMDVEAALATAFRKYRIDPTRVYLTGMSAGGGVSYTYPGSDINNARKFAAIAPIAAPQTILSDATKASNIIDGGAAVLALVNYLDLNTNGTGVNTYANNNAAVAALRAIPETKPRQVTYYTFTNNWQLPSTPHHDGWQIAYRSVNNNWDWPAVFVDTVANNSYENYTLYEWFLLYQNLASPLPVLLKTFTATRINNTVELDWTTLTEINSSYFTLERSVDGMNFSPLAKVDAAGSSVTEKKYKHVDNSLPGSPYVYYRLSQTDKDGKKQIFGIRKVFIGSNGFELRVFPTLTTGTLNVEVQGVSSDAMNIRIVDLSGKILMKQVIAPRQNRVTMDVSRLARGMYILQADNSVHRFTTKFIKQ